MSIQCTCRAVFGHFTGDSEQERLCEAAGFTGAPGQTLMVAGPDTPVLLVGLGPSERVTAGSLREAAALSGRTLKHLEFAAWDFRSFSSLGLHPGRVIQALAEGVTLGSYSYGMNPRHQTQWRGPDDHSLAFWDSGIAVGTAAARARDLVNSPPNLLTPTAFSEYCQRAGRTSGLSVIVRSQEELAELGFGGILAIGGGSAEPSLLVEVSWPGVNPSPDLSLVGKGVTFDSGGLSLKTAEDMIGMKNDMAGAAAVFEAMRLLPLLAPTLHVKAFLPIVENLPGQGAARPGDVVSMRNGRKVEILNTDFEGRVILADALAFAAEESPAAIIDIATLTNAAVRALGDRTAALMSTDDRLRDMVSKAAKSSDEPVWHLPMPAYLREQLGSDVADYKNYPRVETARALTGAMFLAEFIPDEIPWAHLDIAGPAWANVSYGLTPPGGTGFGVRLLADLFGDLASRHAVSEERTQKQ